MLALPFAEEGLLGWGAFGGIPFPSPCSQPCCVSALGSGELAIPLPEGQRCPRWTFLNLDLVKAWDPMMWFNSSSRAAESLRKTRCVLEAGAVRAELPSGQAFIPSHPGLFAPQLHTLNRVSHFQSCVSQHGIQGSWPEPNCSGGRVSLLQPRPSLSPALPCLSHHGLRSVLSPVLCPSLYNMHLKTATVFVLPGYLSTAQR